MVAPLIPIIWGVVKVGSLVGTAIIAACSSSSGGDDEDVSVDGDAFDVASDVAQNAQEVEVETEAGEVAPDIYVPTEKPGYNSKFMGVQCSVADLDINENEQNAKELIGVCSNPLPNQNYVSLFASNVTSWKGTYSPTYEIAVGEEVNATFNGKIENYETVIEQIISSQSGDYEGDKIVVFSGKGNGCMSGISIVPVGEEKHVSTYGDFGFPGMDQVAEGIWHPCGVKSALIAYGDKPNPQIWSPATVETVDGKIGILRSCDLESGNPYSLSAESCNNLPVFVGPNPTAIAEIPNFYTGTDEPFKFAAVLNSEGEDVYRTTYGSTNASLDIVMLTDSPLSESPVPYTIDLGVKKVYPAKELSITEDGKLAVVAAEGKLLIVDIENPENAPAAINDTKISINSIKDMAVGGMKAYLSMKDSVYIYDLVSLKADKIIKVIEDSTADDLGPIAVDKEGIVYAAVLEGGDSGKSKIISINPAEVVN